MLTVENIDARTVSITFDGYRTCYVVRDRKTVLVDCGYPSDHPGLLAGLDRLGLDPGSIDYLALTHIHLDHAGGAGCLTRLNPELIVCVHGRGSRHLVDPARLLHAAARVYGERFAAIGAMLPVPEGNLKTIDSGDTIELGASHLEVHYTPGHAKHHVIFHDPFAAAVFTGDALGLKIADQPNFILTPPSDYDKCQSVDSINRIEALKPKRINFAHCGTYCLNPRERIFEDLKQAHEQWTRCVTAILNETPGIETQAMWKLFLKQQPYLQRYPDRHASFLLSVRGIRTYIESK
ncbi:MBL fold metallo-hydrolase [Desulfococcus sp.]|uniref:MBL fold metallo-hydrolase n=1 Tax=Desulfococcus sp. TaxID=2025834 RepID=UPI003593B38B